jgi:hypothetical protein
MGYSTYIVNQSGQDLYVFWNTGEPGSGWTAKFYVPKGHNCSSNRAGLCISEFGVSTDPDSTYPTSARWPEGVWIDGCLSWGFRIGPGPTLIEAYAWAEGQPGMPGEYPPSSEGCPG